MPRAPTRHGTVRFMRGDSSTSTSAPAPPGAQDAPPTTRRARLSSSLRISACLAPADHAEGGVFMRIGMLEALRVEQREDADTSVMIVVHAIVPNPDYRAFHRFFHDAAEQEHFETTLNRLLLEACGDNSCLLVLDHSRRTGNRSDSIFMIS